MTATDIRPALVPAMPSDGAPSWPGARWIGLVDADTLPATPTLALRDAGRYRTARLWVRSAGTVRGFVDVPVEASAVDLTTLRSRIARLPVAASTEPADRTTRPTVSIVLCTRDRADQLALALDAVLAVDYPGLDVVVVDNAPSDEQTAELIEAIEDPRVRYVHEPQPGLSRARNRGLLAACGEIVAFTDDDTAAEPAWIQNLVDGFARSADIACVAGLVPSGELRTPVQACFDERVTWSSSVERVVHRLSAPPADDPLFPFGVGSFGTGANFALRRDAALRLGGFDEALGAGSRTRGGEDIDMFFRVLAAGYALAYEPSALVWHRHRADPGALLEQAIGYGTGLGAWLTKVAGDKFARRLALRRTAGGIRRLARLGGSTATAHEVGAAAGIDPDLQRLLAGVGRAERRAVLSGAWTYLRTRRTGNPLLPGGSR